ncbi:GNAT family N-acetyltransferase [Streptomyces purpureus]|uniref:GNAT family N-acetyltransferase n=1 Tax=Streptomyces purpureus TaxID=1951 RepID=UPI0003729FAE|nr:GNAT family N-acetyltransferase [Streptomyces purpureus]
MTIEAIRDSWGIPHLRAADPAELAFAQGRHTALDRAWQLEVERHRAQGTSASFLGAAETGWDTFARQVRLADTARRCFERLDPATAAWVTAYVDGVNDGLAEGADRTAEFADTGLAPGRWEPWTPLAVWLSTHILFAGFPTKLWREEVARRLGEEWTELFATDGPGTSGSNGWLVAPGRTATGAALIAGDPHRFIEAPGVYQQIHLACPEYDVVGLAVPGVPGLAHFGHTGHVAWAITNAMADYQDLYRERLRRVEGRLEALGPGGWEPVHTHTETIEVAGGDPVTVEVAETERGPVILTAPDGASAISLRHPPRVTGDLGFSALPALLAARTVDDVDRAFDRWVEPVNVVQAADTAGGLLHRVAGRVPLRDRDNSLRVVPAWEAAHAWQGWHDPLPRAEVDGVAVMANARGLATPLGIEFAAPHRARRIAELLESSTAWSAADMPTIHTDTHLASAAGLLAVVEAVGTGGSAEGAVAEAEGAGVPAARGSDAAGSATEAESNGTGATAVDASNAAGTDAESNGSGATAVDASNAAGTDAESNGSGATAPDGTNAAGSDAEVKSAGVPAAEAKGPGTPAPDRSNAEAENAGTPAPDSTNTARSDAEAEKPGATAAEAKEHRTPAPDGTDAAGSDALATGAGAPAGRRPLSPGAEALRARLLGWDRRMDAASADAGAYAAVRAAVVRRIAAHPALAPLAEPPSYPALFQPWLALVPRVAYALEMLLTRGPVPAADIASAVRDALEEVAAGEPPRAWGETHRLAPWSALPDRDDARWPGLDGDHDCVMSTSSVPGVTDRSARASAARYVWDLADRDNSLWVVPFGASGVPGDPHQTDQLPLWLRGELAPVITDWDRLAREQGSKELYEQTVEGFGTVRVAPVDPARDAALIHSWVSQERARFWGMGEATVEQVREIYTHLDSLSTHHGFLVTLDSVPVALFQTYEPEADRVSECYEAAPGDLGVHLMLAPAGGDARPGFSGKVLGVLLDFALQGHDRLVAEPDAANEKAIARLVRLGFDLGPEVVLPEVDLPEVFIPEKRARLAFFTR